MVSVLPPDPGTQSGLSGLLNSSEFSGLIGGKTGGASAQLYLEIIKSRTAAEYVVDKLNLVKFYDAKTEQEAVEKLIAGLNAEVTKEGIIKLFVDVKTPLFSRFSPITDSVCALSATISNTYVEALDELNREKLVSKAKRTRMYLDEQIKTTKIQLDSTETALMEFQRQNKTVSLPDQVKASIENAAKLKSEIVNNEIQLGLLSNNLREDNDVYVALKSKINELKNQYNKIETGNSDLLLSFKDMPQIGLKLANLLRESKINNEVYLFLQQQYYREKIQENKDLPTVEILDKAIKPERPRSPRLVFATGIGTVSVFLLMSAFFVYAEKRKLDVK
jgi:uncharacterized protein involved in exopolysaccharide biosynthesis